MAALRKIAVTAAATASVALASESLRGSAGNLTARGLTESASASCNVHPGCARLNLVGDCCPHPLNNQDLACCSEGGQYEPQPQQQLPAQEDRQSSQGTGYMLPMTPSCDDVNVGLPNCGPAARCQGEYHVDGSNRVLRATSQHCSYVTFETGLHLNQIQQLDADVRIAPGRCSELDNLAFWFFQTQPHGNPVAEPWSHWDALSEVDLMETYIGLGGVNSVNTNFAATGRAKNWNGYTITGGADRHVTMWVDYENTAGCPATRQSGFLTELREIDYQRELPVVSLYVMNCPPGQPCCTGTQCRDMQNGAHTAWACITVKEAPILLTLSNWGSGHRATPGCEIGVSDVRVKTK